MTGEDPANQSPRSAAGAQDERSGTTHFGFEEVAEAEKTPRVRGVFESVWERYDLMNDLMSGGVHRLWKAAMVDWLNPRPGQSLLDVAGGTGDIAFRVIQRVGPERCGPVVVCDLTPNMLALGRARALDRGLLGGLHWVCANAEALPLPDRCMDTYTIAFGLRNVSHIDRALTEARRVLRPGGRFLCLEFSRVVLPVFARLYDLYSFNMLPAMGELVTYLVESIRRFPAQEDLAAMIGAAGLEQVRLRNLTGGVAALHSAWRF
jgi:demethylmenaquinone methyltransferase/2-methoxy-6-polyprenyl-1,4-benzoquinol methylase